MFLTRSGFNLFFSTLFWWGFIQHTLDDAGLIVQSNCYTFFMLENRKRLLGSLQMSKKENKMVLYVKLGVHLHQAQHMPRRGIALVWPGSPNVFIVQALQQAFWRIYLIVDHYSFGKVTGFFVCLFFHICQCPCWFLLTIILTQDFPWLCTGIFDVEF